MLGIAGRLPAAFLCQSWVDADAVGFDAMLSMVGENNAKTVNFSTLESLWAAGCWGLYQAGAVDEFVVIGVFGRV